MGKAASKTSSRPPPRLRVRWFSAADGVDIPFRYREGSSDESVLAEVVDRHSYRRKLIGFDVLPGEHWLDLGANVGAFALYCRLARATADCYEPSPDCFPLLSRNVSGWSGFSVHQAAVTANRAGEVPFYPRDDRRGRFSRAGGNYQRGSTLRIGSRTEPVSVGNMFAGGLSGRGGRPYDGIKMDIEGGEFTILDGRLLPTCTKFVMEYHATADKDTGRLAKRLGYLKSRFRTVSYVAELDRMAAVGGTTRTFIDRCVWCTDPV